MADEIDSILQQIAKMCVERIGDGAIIEKNVRWALGLVRDDADIYPAEVRAIDGILDSRGRVAAFIEGIKEVIREQA